MLKKQNRLRKRKEFNFVYKKGKVLKGELFNIYYTQTRLKTAKFGIVVSKKVGKSVVRSRVKRLINENIRLNLEKFKVYNYIIVAKDKIVGISLKDIENQLLKILSKESLVK